MKKMYRCKWGLTFERESSCELSTSVALLNPDKFLACKDCNLKQKYESGDYYCVADKVSDSEGEFSKEKVPEEIVIRLPTQFAVDLSHHLNALFDRFAFSHCYPFNKLDDIVFKALEEQLYKVIAPEQYKRIQEILDKYGDEE